MNDALLQRLTEAHGVPGQEDAIRAIVREELKDLCTFETDYLGNLICLKKGKGAKKLMLAAHMDEIGFIVKHVDDKGFLRLNPLGGWDPRQMAAQRVFVHTETGPINGLLMMQAKPKHLLTPDQAGKAASMDEFFVDIGMSGETAKATVKLGDMVTMNRTYQTMGPLCTCKAMDNRVAVYVMIMAMKAAANHDVDVYGVATVQEEIGCRGAAASGWSVQPDVVVAIDVTLALDVPGAAEQDRITTLGEGTAIKIMDSSLICHPKVVAHFRALAEKHDIKHQMEILPAGGTDASGVQRLHGGVPAFTLSVPCRYVHTVNETIHRDDLDASVALLTKYIEDCHNGNYRYE